MARVASNKNVVPRLIAQNRAAEFESLNLQQKNINTVLTGLDEVMKKGGTAFGSAINVNGKRMGGKTGTSQVRGVSRSERDAGLPANEDIKWHLRNHGLFVGYSPTNNPRYAVCVITEHSGSSGPAARATSVTIKELLQNG